MYVKREQSDKWFFASLSWNCTSLHQFCMCTKSGQGKTGSGHGPLQLERAQPLSCVLAPSLIRSPHLDKQVESGTELSPLCITAWRWPSLPVSSEVRNLPFLHTARAVRTTFPAEGHRLVGFGDGLLHIRGLFDPFLANQSCQAKTSEQLRSL